MNRCKMYSLVCAAATAALLLTAMPLRANETDDRIETSFKSSYVAKTYLKDDAVKAAAKDGVVTLTGTVGDESHKGLAVDTAANLPGVTRVDNQLTFKGDAVPEHSDKWIGRKVSLTLFFHRNVNSMKTTVDVADGVVTLTGVAANAAQKELTTAYASDIDGVKEVKNNMTVADKPDMAERTAGEKIDDASISAQVGMVLASHRSTSALRTKIQTREGVVTLTGIAKNAAEKSLVTKLVTDVQGVTSVKNEMTVDEIKTK